MCSKVWRVWRVLNRFEGFEGFEGRQAARLNAIKNRWLGHVKLQDLPWKTVWSVCRQASSVSRGQTASLSGVGQGLRKHFRGLRPGKRQLGTMYKTDGYSLWLRELPWKKLAEGSKGYHSERYAAAFARFAGPAEAFWGFEAGQTAALNAVKNRWLQPVAPRVAMEKAWIRKATTANACGSVCKVCRACGGILRFEAGQMAALNAVKNRWLQPVAPRVAMEKACKGSKGTTAKGMRQRLQGLQSLRRHFGGLRPGKRQLLNPANNRWLQPVAPRVAMEKACEGSKTLPKRGRQTAGLNATKSADPGLGQGRGGAWDHRRCGTWFVTAMAFTMSKLVPASSPPAGPSKATLPLDTSGQTPCFRRPFQSQFRPPQAHPRQLFR